MGDLGQSGGTAGEERSPFGGGSAEDGREQLWGWILNGEPCV